MTWRTGVAPEAWREFGVVVFGRPPPARLDLGRSGLVFWRCKSQAVDMDRAKTRSATRAGLLQNLNLVGAPTAADLFLPAGQQPADGHRASPARRSPVRDGAEAVTPTLRALSERQRSVSVGLSPCRVDCPGCVTGGTTEVP